MPPDPPSVLAPSGRTNSELLPPGLPFPIGNTQYNITYLKPGFHIIVRIVTIAPDHLKMCSGDRDDHMEMLQKKLGTIRTIGTITIASISIRAIGTIGNFCKQSNGNHFQTIESGRLGRSGRFKTVSECSMFLHGFKIYIIT